MQNNTENQAPDTSGITSQVSGCKATFQIILAMDIVEAELDYPENLPASSAPQYIQGHLDEAVVQKRYTDGRQRISLESIQVTGTPSR